MNATIKDIARAAHVSYATVSRALNNKYGVKPATRQKIQGIAKRLNYHPNAIARGLVTRQTRTVGLILPDITNPFFPEVARGIEDGAQEQGYSVFLCNTNWERQREQSYIKLLTEKRVDGLLIAPISNSTDSLDDGLPEEIPVVYVSNAPANTARSYVAIDSVRGGFIAAAHLLDLGHRKLGFIGAVESSLAVDERLEGFKMAHARAGIEVCERYIQLGHFRQETGYETMRRMIEAGDYPRAIFAENDIIALGVIQAVRDCGLSVPADVAVVGFDDIPLASLREIGLTTVYQPKYEMGKMGVQILLEEILAGSGGESGISSDVRPRRIVLEPQLIVRSTTVAAAMGAKGTAAAASEDAPRDTHGFAHGVEARAPG